MFGRKARIRILADKVDKLALNMERSRIRDYICYLENPRSCFFPIFWRACKGSGICRFYAAHSFSAVYPAKGGEAGPAIISEFISDIVRIVENSIRKTGG
jgi:hypothetical protein